MLTGKKLILFGAGIIGRRALNFFGADKVHCFADNNKAGQEYWGKKVISFDDLKRIHSDYDVVITMNNTLIPEIEARCKAEGIRCFRFYRLISYEDCESNADIARFKDKHKGDRCFLIGNGPSLRPEDLTLLHKNNICSFGCNLIGEIYGQTPWRLNYYVLTDPIMFSSEGYCKKLVDTEADYKFFPRLSSVYTKDEIRISSILAPQEKQILYYEPITSAGFTENPRFSPDVSRAAYISGTVMYVMMQLSVYMGFSEIYLLGVDGTASSIRNAKAYLSEKRHFYEENEDSLYEDRLCFTPPDDEEINVWVANAYQKAEEYTRERGVRIYNATRGGVVEAFERVDFDALFRGDKYNV